MSHAGTCSQHPDRRPPGHQSAPPGSGTWTRVGPVCAGGWGCRAPCGGPPARHAPAPPVRQHRLGSGCAVLLILVPLVSCSIQGTLLLLSPCVRRHTLPTLSIASVPCACALCCACQWTAPPGRSRGGVRPCRHRSRAKPCNTCVQRGHGRSHAGEESREGTEVSAVETNGQRHPAGLSRTDSRREPHEADRPQVQTLCCTRNNQ